MIIIIYFFYSGKLNTLEQILPVAFVSIKLLDWSEKNWKLAAVAHSKFPLR